MSWGIEVPCDDCAQGRHFRCDGESWNPDMERVVECSCAENDHIRPTI